MTLFCEPAGSKPESGVIYVLKPPGMPSGGVVGKIKYIMGTRRVGHAGTLDPGAAGVLPVCFGRATRLSEYLTGGRKQYIAEIAFGAATDTQDAFGCVIETSEKSVSENELAQALGGFTGKILQYPPVFSALKINGRPSYELARKGRAVQKPAREVEIFALELLSQTAPDRFLLKIECGSGTYVRTLLYDIGKELGAAAHMSFLLRSSAGGRDVSQAYTLEELKQLREREDYSFVCSAQRVLEGLPALVLPPHRAFALENGLPTDTCAARGDYRLYCGEKFYGIGRADGEQVRLSMRLE